jgi:hypothetical protein
MRRRVAIVLSLALVIGAGFPGVASAEPDEDGIYPMVFPVVGPNYYSDTFGAPRPGGRSHAGQDIMTYDVKGLPVLAVAAGTVKWIGDTCCYLAIEHDDGWETWYIHLNNDTQNPDGTYSDDGQGWGIADGIEVGVRVEAGQLIGWVGDSGNAEDVAPQLHFELRDPDGNPYNPYESLLVAEAPPPPEPLCPEGGDCDTVGFQDSGGKFHLWSHTVSGVDETAFYFGNPGDISFSGDWDCDGVETLGLYRQSDGYVYLRNSNTGGTADITFFFGDPGDVPIAGDFDGDGCDTVSVYRPAEGRFYIINELGADDGSLGAAEYSFFFGNPGDKPFVGDFDGDGVDTIGLHRESTGLVYFRNTNTTGVADFSFIYGDPGDVLVAGDWDGDGIDTVGVYRPSNGMIYFRNSNTAGVADASLYAGDYTGVVNLRP